MVQKLIISIMMARTKDSASTIDTTESSSTANSSSESQVIIRLKVLSVLSKLAS